MNRQKPRLAFRRCPRIAYSYTDNGHRTRTTWARGAWREHAYNDRNLVIGTTYSGTVTPSVAYTYGDSGKVASATLSDGTAYAYSYDDRLLNTSENVTVGGEAFAVNRTYDDFCRPLEMAVIITNVSHSAKVRRYDSENRVCGYALTNAAGRGVSVALQYVGSRLTNMVFTLPSGGTFASMLSREVGRPDLVVRRDYRYGANSIYWLECGFDILGRPTTTVDSAMLVRDYGYNNRNELVFATGGTNSFAYAYDTIGNRASAIVNSETNSYTANNLNQYTSIHHGAETLYSTQSPQYDADGNLTDDGKYSYAYDAENRLISVTPLAPAQGDLSVLNVYDHRHRRILKRVNCYDNGEWVLVQVHSFTYDGNNIVLERITLASGETHTIENFWGNDLSGSEEGAGGVGGLLAVSIDGVYCFPCYDNSRNITRYIGENGLVVLQFVYDPYGNVLELAGAAAAFLRIRFSTKYTDSEVGIISYLMRFYAASDGRWLNRDTVGEGGGENLYAFCQNDPLLYYDPNGKSFEDFSNFCAGAGDSLSFGITRILRRGINRVIEGDWDDPADVESSAYSAGEYTEVVVEIVVSLGGATLRHVAKHSSRQVLEKGARKAYRNAHNILGGVVHHITPIKGHPPVKGMHGGQIARYPLPFEWAARGEWNLTWYANAAEHTAAHRRMMQLESIDQFREITLGTRQLGNTLINRLNSSSDTKCWNSIDLNVYFYHLSDGGVNINGIPESVSISIEETWREQ